VLASSSTDGEGAASVGASQSTLAASLACPAVCPATSPSSLALLLASGSQLALRFAYRPQQSAAASGVTNARGISWGTRCDLPTAFSSRDPVCAGQHGQALGPVKEAYSECARRGSSTAFVTC
jgi:hypothetical protein